MKLLQYCKKLKVVPQKTKDGYHIVYASRGLKMGLCNITPKPTQKEIIELTNWLDKNNLAIPVKTGALNELIQMPDED